MSDFTIRKMVESDVSNVSFIHIKAFKNFFLTSLGKGFLETYYSACLKHQHTIAFCAEDLQGNLVGFATGSSWAKGYHRSIFMNNIFSFLTSLAVSIVKKPPILIRLFKNLEKNKHKYDMGEYAELLSIGVNPDYKGGGVGRELLTVFHDEVRKRGGVKVALTTDKLNNDPVLAFYAKAGYETFYEFTTYPKREMYKLMAIID
ncbi:MAG: GNAT family N-acetyltransferase [Sediminibacterium sp.]|nr:MAG: GNAT family N-acetyltransferase [Sediminibacterium sp.] [Sediminibacterium sp. FEMGT703S]